MTEESEWVRLPGLFRWDEICEVFAAEATPDREWHFWVRVAPEPDGPELLYVVHAARETRIRRAAEPRQAEYAFRAPAAAQESSAPALRSARDHGV